MVKEVSYYWRAHTIAKLNDTVGTLLSLHHMMSHDHNDSVMFHTGTSRHFAQVTRRGGLQ